MEITVKNNQSIVDIAVQETGSAEGLFDLLKLNGRLDLQLTSGTVLKLPNVISPKVIKFFKTSEEHEITVATFSIIPLDNNRSFSPSFSISFN